MEPHLDPAGILPRQVLAAQSLHIHTLCTKCRAVQFITLSHGERHHPQPPSLEAQKLPCLLTFFEFLGPHPGDQHHAQAYMERHLENTVVE